MHVRLTDIQMSILGNKINKNGVLTKLPVMQFSRQDILAGTTNIPMIMIKKQTIDTMGASFEITSGVVDIITQDFTFLVKNTSNLGTQLQATTGSTGETEIRLMFKYQDGNKQSSLVVSGKGIFTATGTEALQQTDVLKLKFNMSYSEVRYSINSNPQIYYSTNAGLYAY